MLHGGATLAVRALRRADGPIAAAGRRAARAGRDVGVGDGALEDGQRGERLVEGHLVAGLVHTHEAERARLLDLPVHDAVGRGQVRVAGGGEAGGGDEDGDGFGAEPWGGGQLVGVFFFQKRGGGGRRELAVADVVRVAGVHHHGNILRQQLTQVLDRAVLPAVVARRLEGEPDRVRELGVVLVGADGGLHGGRVQVIDVVLVGERVGRQLADVVLVAAQVEVVQLLDLVGAEVVGGGADLVDAAGGAVGQLVDAVARAVEVVVHLVRDGGVEVHAVGVARSDSEVVVGGVLEEGAEPAVADQDGLQVDLVRAGDVFGVLGLDVFVEDGAVVAAYTELSVMSHVIIIH